MKKQNYQPLVSIVSVVLVITFVAIPHFATAQLDAGRVTAAECGLLNLVCAIGNTPADIGNQVLIFINGFLSLIAILTFGALVYYGGLYITSRGDEENARKAKNGIMFAGLGFLIAGAAGLIVNVLFNL